MAKVCNPYASDRNPGALVHLEAAGRRAVTDEEDFAKMIRRSMRDLLRAERPISFSEAYSDTPDVDELHGDFAGQQEAT